MSELIFSGLLETLLMVIASSVIGVLLGTPLAIVVFNTGPSGMAHCRWIHWFLGGLINSVRSVPYIILTVLLIPVSRILVGSSIGTLSAVVPLGVSATLLIARVIEDALKTVPKGLIEAGFSMGATQHQIMWKILIPEALPSIVSGLTLVMISLIGFSAMAGAVGGGGLGDLAIRYGYQRYQLGVLGIVVLILIVLVQITQWMGDRLTTRLRK
jgi:D-methionine transport system permease protein